MAPNDTRPSPPDRSGPPTSRNEPRTRRRGRWGGYRPLRKSDELGGGTRVRRCAEIYYAIRRVICPTVLADNRYLDGRWTYANSPLWSPWPSTAASRQRPTPSTR